MKCTAPDNAGPMLLMIQAMIMQVTNAPRELRDRRGSLQASLLFTGATPGKVHSLDALQELAHALAACRQLSNVSLHQAHMEEARAPVPREAAPPAAPAAESAMNPAEGSGAAAPAAEAEADPFNLDAIMEPPAPRRAAAGQAGMPCLGTLRRLWCLLPGSDPAVSLRASEAVSAVDCPG